MAPRRRRHAYATVRTVRNRMNISFKDHVEHVHAVSNRRDVLIAGATLVAALYWQGLTSTVEAAQASATSQVGASAEWLSYSGDKASSKYSPLAQIGRENFKRLKVAWTW